MADYQSKYRLFPPGYLLNLLEMSVSTRWKLGVVGLLLIFLGARPALAQRLPARSMGFDAVGADSATGQPVEIHLLGRAVGSKGRTYAGKCVIKASVKNPAAAKMVGEWQFTQNSSANVSGGQRPAIGGMGTRVGSKPWKPGQNPSAAGQVINFTIDPLPDGRYTVLLMDTFNDDMLEFKYTPSTK